MPTPSRRRATSDWPPLAACAGGGGRPAPRRPCPAASAPPARAGWSSLVVLLVWVVVLLARRRAPVGSPTGSTPPLLRAVAELRTELAHRRPRRRRPARFELADVRRRRGAHRLALIVLKRWRHLFTFLGSVLALELIGQRPLRRLPPAPRPTTSRSSATGPASRCPPCPVAVAHHLLSASSTRWCPPVGRAPSPSGVGGRRRGLSGGGRALPGDVPSLRRARGRGAGRRRPAQRLPLRSRRTRSSRSPTGGARPPTSTSAVGGARPSRQAVRDQLGLVVTEIKPVGLAGSGGSTPLRLRVAGRARHLPVREALRHEPRAGRPLVQARPHDPLRPPGGRGAVPVGAPAGAVRGLRPAAAPGRRHPTAAPAAASWR